MEPILNQANIVMVAPNHRPDIVSKEWLNKNDILKEAPVNFVHHQSFSLVETTNYSINVVQQRLTIAARNSNQDTLNHLQTIANRYIKALPDVSYNAVGLNSNWMILMSPDLLKRTFIPNEEQFNKAFRDKTGYDIGGIVRFQFNSFWVQLTLTPRQDDQINADFNYHSDITEFNQLRERISHFTEAVGRARNTIIKLLGD